MKKLLLALPLALCACGTLDTPQAGYLASLEAATAATGFANSYMAECLKQPVTDPCYDRRDEIDRGVTLVEKARAQSKAVFETGNSKYYSLSMTVLENAVAHLNTLTGKDAE